MPNYCPACGTKVDQSYKFCLSCGAQLQPEDTLNPSKHEEQATQGSTPQEPTTQQSFEPTDQSKSNKNLLIALIAIIAVIIIVVIVIMLTGGGNIDNRFVGEWEQSDEGFMTINWNFNSDGSLEIMGMNFATWGVKGDQLCFKINDNEFWGEFMPEENLGEVCYNFEFSNGGNTVSLSIDGSENFVLTKK